MSKVILNKKKKVLSITEKQAIKLINRKRAELSGRTVKSANGVVLFTKIVPSNDIIVKDNIKEEWSIKIFSCQRRLQTYLEWTRHQLLKYLGEEINSSIVVRVKDLNIKK